jgi:hypothetical protein
MILPFCNIDSCQSICAGKISIKYPVTPRGTHHIIDHLPEVVEHFSIEAGQEFLQYLDTRPVRQSTHGIDNHDSSVEELDAVVSGCDTEERSLTCFPEILPFFQSSSSVREEQHRLGELVQQRRDDVICNASHQ